MNSNEQLFFGTLALLSDSAKPEGPEPTVEELALLVEGALPEGRAREVWTYIARTDRVFLAWAELSKALSGEGPQADLSPKPVAEGLLPRTSRRRWWTYWSPYVGAALVTMLAVAVTLVLNLSPGARLSWHADRAVDEMADVFSEAGSGRIMLSALAGYRGRASERQAPPLHEVAFGQGLRAGVSGTLRDLGIAGQYGELGLGEPADAKAICGDQGADADCYTYHRLGVDAGKVAATVLSACSAVAVKKPVPESAWTALQMAVSTLDRELNRHLAVGAQAAALADWSADVTGATTPVDVERIVCAGAAQIIPLLDPYEYER